MINLQRTTLDNIWPIPPPKDSGRHMERSHVQHRGVKADWAAKITGHCSGEAALDGRPHHQDATWTTSQSCYVMDSSWKWQETRSANKDMAVHIQRRPCGQKSRLEQCPGCGYRQAQMANSCCPLSWQGLEDLSAKCKYCNYMYKPNNTMKNMDY